MKHPLGLKVIHTQGQNKPASLLEVDRNQPVNDADYLNRVSAGLLIYPNHAYFYTLAADKYYMMQDFRKAQLHYTSALGFTQTNQEKIVLSMNRAKAFLNMHELEKAKKDVDVVLSISPRHEEALQAAKYIDELMR